MATTDDNIIGSVFGMLTVLGISKVLVGRKNPQFWPTCECRCECGVVKNILRAALRAGRAIHCGCLRHRSKTRHGDYGSDEYNCWRSMRSRCQPSSTPNRAHYYDRGITVCERWNNYSNFLEDMGRRPTPEHSIERLDNNKGYEPGNCVWATRQQQSRNRRSSRWLTAHGETKVLVEWANALGVSRAVVRNRISNGWSVEDAVITPLRKSPSGTKDLSRFEGPETGTRVDVGSKR